MAVLAVAIFFPDRTVKGERGGFRVESPRT
jgi:hypothetical protein